MQKKLIIVCEESERKYASYLQQLVSAADDEDGKQVGTKDGEVSAAIFSEKQYEDNLHQLTSTNHVLFIGNGKIARAARANMDERFAECGMHFGWLGHQAYMYADAGEFKRSDSPKFQTICEKYGKSFDSLLQQPESEEAAIEAVHNEAGGIEKAARGIARFAISRVNAAAKLAKDLSWETIQKKDVRDQQYSMLTLILYMDGLSEFLGV